MLRRFVARAALLAIAVLPLAEVGAAFSTSGRTLLRDGAPFFVRGVCYHPVPIGFSPSNGPAWGDYCTSDFAALHARDLPLLRAMHANVVRVYGWDPVRGHTAYLDACYNGGTDPLFVLVNLWVDPATDWSNASAVSAIAAQFAMIEDRLANHPAVLAIVIGNEANVVGSNGTNPAFWSAMNAIAGAIKARNSARLVSAAITDALAQVASFDAAVTNFDFWSVQVYRGTTFGSFFTDYAARSARPLVITEFGLENYDHRINAVYPRNGAWTADVLASLWREMSLAHATTSGGCFFEFCDDWGKVGSLLTQDPGGYAIPSLPDGVMDEEYFGLFRIADNGSAPDLLTPRDAVARISALWAQPQALIRRQPEAVTGAVGASAMLTVEAVSPHALTYQWRRNGIAVPGATSATLTFSSLSPGDAGDYDVAITVSGVGSGTGTLVSESARVVVATPVASRIVNLSIRGVTAPGDTTLITGLSVSGGSDALQVLTRVVGPGLIPYGVAGTLADPQLALFSGSAQVGSNDNWATGGTATLREVFGRVGAFDLTDISLDAALVSSIGGSRTVHALTPANTSGVVLVELYDATTAPGAARLVNLSARTLAGAGDSVLIAGFAISGNTPHRVLVRGIGPTLQNNFGVSGAMIDPVLRLFDSRGSIVATNDNWADAPDADLGIAAATQTGAFALPVGRDAMLVRTLSAGTYTAHIASAVAGESGIALVEVYELP